MTFFFSPASNTRRALANTPFIRSGGLLAHLAVIHEVLPLRGRHQHLGIRERQRVFRGQEAVDVVAVEVRDHHHVDRLGVEACGDHVGGELSDIALARRERGGAVAGVDHDQLAAGIDDQRRELDRHLVFRHERLFERRVDFVLLDVEHERIGQREVVDAVGDDRHLGVANLVAIEARRLLFGGRRGGLGGHCGNSGVAARAAAPASA